MTGLWQILRAAGLMAVGAVYLGLGYIAASSDDPPLVSLLVGLLPLAALALTVAWQSGARLVTVPLCLAVLIWAVWNLQLLRGHVAAFYFVQHVGAMVMLGLMFGSTLFGGHDKALCSRIAAMVMPEALAPDYMRYTWQVTLVWTLFFVSSGCVSVGLFFWGPLAWWALFANVLTPVLVGGLFVAEYLVRIRILPNRPHLSIAGTVQAYQRFRNSANNSAKS